MYHRGMLTALAVAVIVLSASAEAGDVRQDPQLKRVWEISDSERLARRFDPGQAALRRSHAIAAGHTFSSPQAGVVIGSRNPELLLRWELMDHIVRAYHPDPAIRDGVRKKWLERGAEQYLGADFWPKLYAAAAPFIEASLENRRLTVELRTIPEAKRGPIQARRNHASSSICGLRADALAASRVAFGKETLDAFLYEVLAVEPVIDDGVLKPAAEMAGTYLWIEGGCR